MSTRLSSRNNEQGGGQGIVPYVVLNEFGAMLATAEGKTDEQTKIYCSHHRRGARGLAVSVYMVWDEREKALGAAEFARSNKYAKSRALALSCPLA